MWPFKAKSSDPTLIRQEGTLSNIHLRPTKLGYSLSGVCFAVWVGAANYQVNVAYAVCFWLAGFIAVSALMTRRQLLGLHIRIHYSGEVFSGQTAQVQLDTFSPTKRTRLFWWRSIHGDNKTISAWQRTDMPKGQTHHHLWSIPVIQRGYFPYPLKLEFGTSAPFGLFHVRSNLEWSTDAVVFPSPIEHQAPTPNIPSDPDAAPQQTGNQGDDIAFLKAHQDGTSLQHIAWKTYAKRGELMDKVFDEPPKGHHKETISYRDYPPNISVDRLAGLLTYRVLQAERIGTPYYLELPRTTITPQNGQREKCLNTLALM